MMFIENEGGVVGAGHSLPSFLREPQYTPGAYPRHPQMKGIPNHKLVVGGVVYVPWDMLENS